MKLSVGTVLAIVTLIGTILIGGANFGELRSATKTNSHTILEYRMDLERSALELRTEARVNANAIRKESMENMRIVAKMSADIEWIKENIRRREDRNETNH
jgi:hypothetical protein